MPSTAFIDRQRGRPREFGIELAVEKAMQVFWSEGYHRTSLPDLLTATALSRGSLYAAFGDKRGLFLLALSRYIDQALARLDQELGSGSSALAGVRACLDGYVGRVTGSAGKRGCLVVAATMELAAHDPDVAHRISRFFQSMEARLTTALARARAEGDLVGDADPATLAHLLVCTAEGLRVVSKVGSRADRAKATVAALIDRIAA